MHYCGMKDTVMPGIFDRISGKARFVSQALAGRGVGVEFEDAGSLDLDQMKAGLISDKRVLEHAELQLSIKEAKTQLEIVVSRRASLEQNRQFEKMKLDGIDEDLPKIQAKVDALKSSVVPPISSGEAWFVDTVGNKVEGDYKSVLKELGKIIEKWKAIEFKDLSAVVRKLGRLNVNGMNIDVTKEVVDITTNKAALIGKCHTEATGYMKKEFTFATPEAVMRMVQSSYERELEEPDELLARREYGVKTLAALDEQISKCGDGLAERVLVQGLSEKLVELETRMRTQPYVRRSSQQALLQAGEPVVEASISEGESEAKIAI